MMKPDLVSRIFEKCETVKSVT